MIVFKSGYIFLKNQAYQKIKDKPDSKKERKNSVCSVHSVLIWTIVNSSMRLQRYEKIYICAVCLFVVLLYEVMKHVKFQ